MFEDLEEQRFAAKFKHLRAMIMNNNDGGGGDNDGDETWRS